MSIDVTKKSAKVRVLVQRVRDSEVGPRLTVIDHWEADLEAIGFTGRAHGGTVVYVSTWEQPKGSVYWSVETGPGKEERSGVTDTDGLIEVLRRCFPAPSVRAV